MQRTIRPGDVFGRLTVIEHSRTTEQGRWYKCSCECTGKTTEIIGKKLGRDTNSCGCLVREKASENAKRRMALAKGDKTKHPNYRHGHTINGDISSERHAHRNMKARCTNPKIPNYKNYGGRGIQVCERWMGRNGFINFLADMGLKPGPEYSLDRINVNGNYEPGNVRWATPEEQAKNKRNNHLLTCPNCHQEAPFRDYLPDPRHAPKWMIEAIEEAS